MRPKSAWMQSQWIWWINPLCLGSLKFITMTYWQYTQNTAPSQLIQSIYQLLQGTARYQFYPQILTAGSSFPNLSIYWRFAGYIGILTNALHNMTKLSNCQIIRHSMILDSEIRLLDKLPTICCTVDYFTTLLQFKRFLGQLPLKVIPGAGSMQVFLLQGLLLLCASSELIVLPLAPWATTSQCAHPLIRPLTLCLNIRMTTKRESKGNLGSGESAKKPCCSNFT